MWKWLVLLALAGCATEPEVVFHAPAQTWTRQTAYDPENLKMESAQCRAQALGVTQVSSDYRLRIYEACMQGKGWRLVQK